MSSRSLKINANCLRNSPIARPLSKLFGMLNVFYVLMWKKLLRYACLGRCLPPYQVASWSIQAFGQKWGLLCPFFRGGELGLHLTQCPMGRGLPLYQVGAVWSIQPFGHNRHGPKIGGCGPFLAGEELGPHLTQCGIGCGLPSYQVSFWSIQPLTTIDIGRKLGAVPLWGAGSQSNSIPNGILTHPTVWPQYTNVTRQNRQTDRTDNGL